MLTRCTFLLLSALLLLAAPVAESAILRPVIARRQTQQTEHAATPAPRAAITPRPVFDHADTTTHRPYRPAPANRPPPSQA